MADRLVSILELSADLPAERQRFWAGFAGESAWLDADTEEARETIAHWFADYKASPANPPDTGVFATFGGSRHPRFTSFYKGEVCSPARMFANPEWKRFTPIAHATRRLYADSLFGPEKPALEVDGSDILVLQPDTWHLYLGFPHGWLLLQERTLAILHAAVSAAHGTALVLLGASGSGKSTLSLALMEEGADCFGDECAIFRLPEFTLTPWSRPLRMRPGGLETIGQPAHAGSWQEIRPGDPKYLIDLAAPKAACPADRVGFFFLDGFGEKPAISQIAPSEASRKLLSGMMYAEPGMFERLSVAADLVSRYPCWTVRLGPPADTARMLIEHVGDLA